MPNLSRASASSSKITETLAMSLEIVCFKSCRVGLGDGSRETTAVARQRILVSSRWNPMWEVNWRANAGVLWRLKRTVDIRDGSRLGERCLMKCH
ncbi:hypothetical protein V6N13_105259 [Hibiscus sabdariffa]